MIYIYIKAMVPEQPQRVEVRKGSTTVLKKEKKVNTCRSSRYRCIMYPQFVHTSLHYCHASFVGPAAASEVMLVRCAMTTHLPT